MMPDSVFYPAMTIFVILATIVYKVASNGMDRAQERSPAGELAGMGCWTIFLVVGALVSCLIAAQLSGHKDVLNILFGA